MGKFKNYVRSLSKSQKFTSIIVFIVIAILAVILAVATVNLIL